MTEEHTQENLIADPKVPFQLRVIAVLLGINFLYLAGVVIYLLYLAQLAESGALSTWQSQFLHGFGFNPTTYSYSDHAKYTGIIAMPMIFVFTNFLFAILKKPNMLMASLLISVFIFQSGPIGMFVNVVSFFLLLIPSSMRYFKQKKAYKLRQSVENV